MGRPTKSQCKFGHNLMGDNLYLSPKGARGCRKCRSKYAHDAHKNDPMKMRRYRKAWYEKNPGYDRERHSGFDHETFERKLKEQNSKCAICERVMSCPCGDHDHETGQLRDLLCSSCNSALGFLQDDPAVAARAYEYLFRWKAV